MSRSVLDRLKDILYSADLAARYAAGLKSDTLAAANQERDAVLFRIAIIGEIASTLPREILALAPEIPWIAIKNMRNHIIHGYWQIDFGIVANTIASDLEPLKATAYRLISLMERTQ
ncbi:MAG TPA: HepT-like ribonuclease domain-containing protein [Xanthobacteraceae bacterium]|jgi:uncharacterized protein with HEPN domain